MVGGRCCGQTARNGGTVPAISRSKLATLSSCWTSISSFTLAEYVSVMPSVMHSLRRVEVEEHPFVKQAKQIAREAGSTDNATVNWALKLLEDSLSFGNRGHGRSV